MIVSINQNNYWKRESTVKYFTKRSTSKYITGAINEIILDKEANVLDIGCGAGRYSKYLLNIVNHVFAIDKYEEMAKSLKQTNIIFKTASMDKIPFESNSFDLILSIGVMHNAVTVSEFNYSIREINRLLKPKAYSIVSVFTNDIITNDLTKIKKDVYGVKDRLPIVLLSKKQINKLFFNNNLTKLKVIDEHITNVKIGYRYVYSVLLQK